MKRFLSIWFLLVLALPAVALADSNEWVTYTHPVDGYQIDYPLDWLVADKDSIDMILDDLTAGRIKGMDAPTLESSREMMLNAGLAMFIAPGNNMNFNVLYEDVGQELTAQDLVEVVCPGMVEQFRAMFDDMEVLVPGDVMTAGDVEYAYLFIQCQTNDEQAMISQTYTMRGTKLYIITYTLFPERGLDLEAANAVALWIGASFV